MRSHKKYLVPILILLFGSAISFLAFQDANRARDQERIKAFTAKAEDHITSIAKNIDRVLQKLPAIEGFFDASNHVDRQEFEIFVSTVRSAGTAIQTFEWIPRVGHPERAAFEQAARDDGLPNFTITEKHASRGMVPAAERPEYFPVYYVEPLAGNEAALGFDLRSDPASRATLDFAGSSGEMAATAPITLVQDTGDQVGVLVFLPVYHGRGIEARTAAAREKALTGFALAVIQVSSLIETAIAELGPGGLHQGVAVFVEDVSEPGVSLPLYGDRRGLPATSPLVSSQVLAVAGRQWRTTAYALADSSYARQNLLAKDWALLGLELLLTFGFALYVLQLAERKEIIGGLVEEKSAEILEREGLLQAVLDNTVDGMITIEEDGTVITFNRASEKIFGYRPDEVIGQNVKMLMPEPFHSAHDGYLKAYCDTDEAKIIGIGREVEGQCKDGSTFPLDLSVSEVQRHGKRIFSGIVRDIAERKLGEERLRQSVAEIAEREGLLQVVLDNTVDGMITITDRGIVTSFNKACEKIFGYRADEVIGQNVNMLTPEPFHSAHDGYLKAYRDTGESRIIGIGREVEAKRKDGTIFPLDLSVSEVRRDGQRIFSGVMRDISERKSAEATLTRTLEDLRYSNDELEKFAYVASHDLQSPLRGIHNLANWLEEDLADQIDAKSRERLDLLKGRVVRMEHLLNDLLEFSRAGRDLDAGDQVEAPALVQDVVQLLNLPAGMSVVADSSLQGLELPRAPLGQVLQNLIGNAAKHHDKPTGQITIRARDIGTSYEIVVADDGPGIAERYHDKVFDMFQTLRPRDEVEGSGMGLALVKKIVHRFGGSVSLSSQEGKGSEFSFTWPKTIQGNSVKEQLSGQHSPHPPG